MLSLVVVFNFPAYSIANATVPTEALAAVLASLNQVVER